MFGLFLISWKNAGIKFIYSGLSSFFGLNFYLLFYPSFSYLFTFYNYFGLDSCTSKEIWNNLEHAPRAEMSVEQEEGLCPNRFLDKLYNLIFTPAIQSAHLILRIC